MRRRLRRTWPQRLLLGVNVVLVLASLGTAWGLWYGYNDIAGAIKRVIITPEPDTVQAALADPTSNVGVIGEEAAADLTAENFLVVGIDSRACQPENPQYAGAFGDEGGGNTDTLMLVRLDPHAERAAILSFPRDLWIRRPDSGRDDRINALFENDPNLLIDGIRENFGLPVHHSVGIDFCGFRDLVNAVGGVKIPFEYPARDRHTGLSIDTPGCVEFGGDEALAYARSRYYEWQDDGGDWHQDPTSDYGRVARQQDFVRRVLRKAVDKGATNPSGLKRLLDVAKDHITLDSDLSIQDVYDWGRALRDVPPEEVRSFTIVGHNAQVSGKSVQTFDLTEAANAEMIAVFSGQEQPSTETLPADAATAGPGSVVSLPAAPTDDTTPPSTDVAPPSTNERNAGSIVPPNDPSCT